MQESVDSLSGLMTLDELCERVGMSVRNVRFYTTRGLVPSPIRRGRSGYYTNDHAARLELVSELQAHGFTLAAIERYVASIPDEAPAGKISLHRALLAPWMAEHPERMTLAQLNERASRELTEEELQTLAVLGAITPGPDGAYDVAVAHLDAGLRLVRFGYPHESAEAAKDLYDEHAHAMASDMLDLFRKKIWPALRQSGASDEDLTEAVELLKPLSIAALVSSYERAVNENMREEIARRAGDEGT
ncbi:MerR family transcriptional regulator [Nocardioides sp. JQ2195]|uniref:MerR family transcriptional regulator n=1 Tax=Nocardioides sp. JQ2195 TaxID=2592334 RepID=UPI00143EB1E9|nr:MerR family transcriptional regulator [Nocardioides sp. JQ2195]QIX28336.1 MerR family transcriptional regulator [Nocardioides sp. JQ2195]